MPDVKIVENWDLSPLEKGKSFEEKRKDWKGATDSFVKKWKGREDYLENPEVLKEALDDYEKWANIYGSEGDEAYYYWLKNELNQSDPELKAKFLSVEEFSKNIENEMSFFSLNISKISEAKQREFLESENLKEYRHYLEKLFLRKKYLLSENEEKIMNLKSTSAYSMWVKMLSGFLSREEAIVLDEEGKEAKETFSDLFSLIRNKDKRIRDRAAEAINGILKKNSDIAESEINAVLNNKKTNDEIRGYERPDKSRHVSDDIESEIVDSLTEAVSEKLEISKRFYEFKAKLLRLKKLEYHERNLSYGELNKKYDYNYSMELVGKVLNSIDEKFGEIFRRLVENGQVDAYPKKGKREGAFCSYGLKSQPTYVLLNYTSTLNDITTIAHEMGHAINDELIKEKQNAINFGTPTSTAEVASTFMEDFVIEELLKSADDETRLALMVEKLDGDVSSIIRQISCYRFEQELHKEFRKKGYLSKEEIGKMFQKYMSSYMGDFVEQSEGSENWWIYWWHIRNYFYNYSYASGLLISKTLQSLVKSDKSNIEKVKEFLSAGLSKSPKEIFSEMDIDITKKEFWEKGLKEIENLLNETEELARKLGKI